MKAKYNHPYEVPEKFYDTIMHAFRGITAGRKANGKCFVKLLHPQFGKELGSVLNQIGVIV